MLVTLYGEAPIPNGVTSHAELLAAVTLVVFMLGVIAGILWGKR